MFSKHDQIQGYDDELLSAINAEERRQEQIGRASCRERV